MTIAVIIDIMDMRAPKPAAKRRGAIYIQIFFADL